MNLVSGRYFARAYVQTEICSRRRGLRVLFYCCRSRFRAYSAVVSCKEYRSRCGRRSVRYAYLYLYIVRRRHRVLSGRKAAKDEWRDACSWKSYKPYDPPPPYPQIESWDQFIRLRIISYKQYIIRIRELTRQPIVAPSPSDENRLPLRRCEETGPWRTRGNLFIIIFVVFQN